MTRTPFPSHPTGPSDFPTAAYRLSSSHGVLKPARVLDDCTIAGEHASSLQVLHVECLTPIGSRIGEERRLTTGNPWKLSPPISLVIRVFSLVIAKPIRAAMASNA